MTSYQLDQLLAYFLPYFIPLSPPVPSPPVMLRSQAVMVLSLMFLSAKYNKRHLVGVVLCLCGLGLTVASDMGTTTQGGEGYHPYVIRGDVLCIIGAMLYSGANVMQENFVKNHDRVRLRRLRNMYRTLLKEGVIRTCVAFLAILNPIRTPRLTYSPSSGFWEIETMRLDSEIINQFGKPLSRAWLGLSGVKKKVRQFCTQDFPNRSSFSNKII